MQPRRHEITKTARRKTHKGLPCTSGFFVRPSCLRAFVVAFHVTRWPGQTMSLTRRPSITCAIVLLSVLAACGRGAKSGGLTIAVIPKGTSHVFWRSIHAGAEKAARELGATVIWRGPLREDDRDAQVSEVEGFITRGESRIVLEPLDETAR